MMLFEVMAIEIIGWFYIHCGLKKSLNRLGRTYFIKRTGCLLINYLIRNVKVLELYK